MRLAVPNHLDRVGLVDGQAADQVLEITRVLQILARDRRDDVAFLKSALGGWRILFDANQFETMRILEAHQVGNFRRKRPNRNSQVAAMDDAVLHELADHVLGEVARDGQANALEAAATALDGGVDADNPTFQVDQRTTAIAWIDGGIGLDVVFVHAAIAARPLRPLALMIP